MRSVPVVLSVFLSLASLTAESRAQPCVPPLPGLVVWWDADDVKWDPGHSFNPRATDITNRLAGPPLELVDISQASNPSLWLPQFAPGRVGQAFSFNPTHPQFNSLRMSIPGGYAGNEPRLTTAMSIALWMKWDWSLSYHSNLFGLIECGAGGYYFSNYGYLLYGLGTSGPSGSPLYFRIGSGSQASEVSTTTNVKDGAWHHIVATFDASLPSANLKIYVDGVFEASQDWNQPIAYTANGCSLATGPTSAGFRGLIDEVMIYDRALAAAEVGFAYQSPGRCRPVFPARPNPTAAIGPFSNIPFNRRFGEDMDLDGDVLAVAEPANGQYELTGVHVFRRNGSSWVHAQSVVPNTPAALNNGNGRSVAVSGNVLVQGIWRGFAVHRFDGTSWNSEFLYQNWPNGLTSLGTDVDVSGDTLVVGAPGSNPNVEVYRHVAGQWQQEAVIPGPTGSRFGQAVGLNGDLMVVGAPAASPGGAVFVYRRTGTTWNLLDTVLADEVAPGRSSYNNFMLGHDLDLDGERVLVGALGSVLASGYSHEWQGSGFVLDLSGGSAVLEGELRTSLPTQSIAYGTGSVRLRGNLAVLGAWFGGEQSAYRANSTGSACVFARQAGAWTEVGRCRGGGGDIGLGYSVALDGARVIATTSDSQASYGTPYLWFFDGFEAATTVADVDPPVVAIDAPVNGAVIGTTSVLLSGSVTDASTTDVSSTPAGVAAALPAGGGPVSGTVALLAEGENVLSLTATDAASNVGGNSVTVIRDTTPPVIAVLSPAEGAVLGSTPASFSAEVTDLTATTLDFGTNHVPLPASGGVAVGDVALVEGPNTVTFVATDAAGHVRTAERRVALDLAAPVVRIDTPLDGASFGPGQSPVAVVATVTDLSATDVSSSPAGVASTLQAGGGIATGAVPLQEGFNTIVVSALDQTNRSGSGSIVVVLDTTAPAVAVTSPAADASVRGVIDFDATALDALPGSGITRVEFAVDGNVVSIVAAPPYESTIDTTSLTQGVHTLAATAVDGKNNRATSTVQVLVDNTRPTVDITQPANNTIVGGTIAFNATASDGGAGVAALTMLAAGVAPQPVDGSTTFAPALATGAASSQVDTRGFADGPLVLAVRALDAAGNDGMATVTVEVDNQAPDRSLLSPADGAVVHGTIDLVAAAQDPNLTLLEILVDSVVVGSSPTGQLTVPYDTTSHGDGSMVITVRATDRVGNRSTDSIRVTVDNIGGVHAECDLRPETLNLRSRSECKSVTLKIEGASLARLMPTENHGWELRVPGGSPVPSTAGFAGDDVLVDRDHDGKPELLVKFDRRLLIASIQAGICAGRIRRNSVLVVEIWADGGKICEDTMRIVH